MKELLLSLADNLDEQADEKRRRAMIAQQQRAIPDVERHRWVSVWTTSYQTLRGAAAAVRATAEGLPS